MSATPPPPAPAVVQQQQGGGAPPQAANKMTQTKYSAITGYFISKPPAIVSPPSPLHTKFLFFCRSAAQSADFSILEAHSQTRRVHASLSSRSLLVCFVFARLKEKI